jgi:hypothetical protein
MPFKGSLSKIRKRISYSFFAGVFKDLVDRFEPYRQTYKGLRIYAIDGLQMTLPRTDDLIKHGFNGRAVSKHRDSYMPRMWFTHCYDVLSGVSKAFEATNRLNEIEDAQDMIQKLEKNSLTLYDRLYISSRLIQIHHQMGSYFLFRARKSALKEIRDFYKSRKTRDTFVHEGCTIHLIKIKNPRTKEMDVFATNLPLSWVKKKIIRPLYSRRWEVENSFREITQTLQLEQWHSKFTNGIFQELYAAMWLINFTKIQMFVRGKRTRNPLAEIYKRPNFKLILNWLCERFDKIMKGSKRFLAGIKLLITISTERRKHHSRSYRREIKSPASPYPYNNTVWNVS